MQQQLNAQQENESSQVPNHTPTNKSEARLFPGQKPSVQTKSINPIESAQGRKPPIQAKQRPIQAKQRPIQAKQRPVQRNQGTLNATGIKHNEAQVKTNVSQLMGTNVQDAQVNYDSSKPAQFKAEGIAQGNQVDLAPGKTHHLGHELVHVAQQKQGRVQPTVQGNNGVGINNDTPLEKEADMVGAQAQNMSPAQLKTQQSSSSESTPTSSSPMQLKPIKGEILAENKKGTIDVYKSNIKKVDGRSKTWMGKAPKEVVVSTNSKTTLSHQEIVYFDPEKLDATGQFVWVRYKSGSKQKIGFIRKEHVTQWLSEEEKQALKNPPKENPQLQEEIVEEEINEETQTSSQAQEPLKSPREQIRDKANLGVEIEFRNLVINRTDGKHWKSNAAYKLTSGGTDGWLVTDQHQESKAVIEWASSHPASKDSQYGADFQQKIEQVNQILRTNDTGTLEQLINVIGGILDVGTVVSSYKDLPYENLAHYNTHTQVNMEVPFKNIGKIPQNETEEASDSAKLFSGASSKRAGQIFVESRIAANKLAALMIREAAKDFGTLEDNEVALVSPELASLLTVFLHTAIHQGVGGGKDTQGVLFKTGAGDLTRLALAMESKAVLWSCLNGADSEKFLHTLANRGIEVYKKAYGDRGGEEAITKVYNAVFRMGMNNFRVENRKYSQGIKYYNAQKALLKELRWNNEAKKHRYGNQVRNDWYTDKAQSNFVQNPSVTYSRHFTTSGLSGAATGKEFSTATHSDEEQEEQFHYLVAEIRRNDNELNKLAKKKGISDEKREELKKLIQDLQTPM